MHFFGRHRHESLSIYSLSYQSPFALSCRETIERRLPLEAPFAVFAVDCIPFGIIISLWHHNGYCHAMYRDRDSIALFLEMDTLGIFPNVFSETRSLFSHSFNLSESRSLFLFLFFHDVSLYLLSFILVI